MKLFLKANFYVFGFCINIIVLLLRFINRKGLSMVNLTKGVASIPPSNGVAVQPLSLSTGFIKVGDKYINPHEISSMQPSILGTSVDYKPIGTNNTVYSKSDEFNVDCDKFAQCAVKAMQTGDIIDVMA